MNSIQPNALDLKTDQRSAKDDPLEDSEATSKPDE